VIFHDTKPFESCIIRTMIKKLFCLLLVGIVGTTQAHALNVDVQNEAQVLQNTLRKQVNEFELALGEDFESDVAEETAESNETEAAAGSANRRLTLRDRMALKRLGRPGIRNHAIKKVMSAYAELTADQKARFIAGAKAANEADLKSIFVAEIDSRIEWVKQEIATKGVRAVKRQMKQSMGHDVDLIGMTRGPASVLLVGAIALVAVAAILVVIQVAIWVLLPIVILVGITILIVKSSESNRCTRGGCPNTRRMVGY
jgi:hypothetical protein